MSNGTWINVTQRTPKPGQTVTVCDRIGGVSYTAKIQDHCWVPMTFPAGYVPTRPAYWLSA